MKKRVFLKIFVILILYVMMFPYTILYAATSAEAGRYVASYAKNFVEKNKIRWTMDYWNVDRLGVFEGAGKYASECVGFVKKMYKEALNYEGYEGIPVPSSNKPYCVYNEPANTQAGKRGPDFELIGINDLSKANPGDIIENFHHDMIYVGNINGLSGVIVNNGSTPNGLITMDAYQNYAHSGNCSGNCNFRIWRLTEEAAAKLGDASTFNANGDLVEAGLNSHGKGGLSQANMSNFYYNGIPDGKYSVTKGFLERIIDALKDIFNFLIALIPNIIKMVFVGWAAIFESLITTAVKTATGDENLESVPVTSTDIESGDNITIEKIVFNKMSIFDVNFFNSNQ